MIEGYKVALQMQPKPYECEALFNILNEKYQ